MDKKLITKYISASLLGDGGLRKFKSGVNAAYGFKQVSKHKEYVDWLSSVVGEITGVTVREYGPSEKEGVNRQGYFHLESRCHPFLTTLYDRWYIDGRKTISLHDMKQFDWEMAAIWYMDDGYILGSPDKYHNGNVFLCTDCFSESEVVMLQKIVYTSLGVAMDVIKRGKRKDGSQIYRLKAKNKQAELFLRGVEPHLFNSFKYKLRTKNSDLSDGDIVCASQGCGEVSRND